MAIAVEVEEGAVEARVEVEVPVATTDGTIVGTNEEVTRGRVGVREDRPRPVVAIEGVMEGARVVEVIEVVVVVGMVVKVVVGVAVDVEVGEVVALAEVKAVVLVVGVIVEEAVGAAVGEDVFIGTNNVGSSEGYPTTPLAGATFVFWLANNVEVEVAAGVGLEVG